MLSSWVPSVVLLTIILLAEGVLWLLFRRKAITLYTPELKTTHFPSPLTFTHITTIAITHTVFLVLSTIIVTLLLW